MAPDDDTHICGIDLREPRVARLARVLGVVGDVYDWADRSSWAVFLRNGMLPLGDAGVRPSGGGMSRVARWRHASPAEALEALATDGLLPASWTDPALGPGWGPDDPCACETGRCAACRGDLAPGFEPGLDPDDPCRCPPDCDVCRKAGQLRAAAPADTPPSHAALVSVASLGPDALAAAEHLARGLAPGARVAWISAGERRLAAHHRSAALVREATHFLPHHFSLGEAAELGEVPKPVRIIDVDRWDDSHDYQELITAKQPALDALREMGAHLLDVTRERVTLGVASLRTPSRPARRGPQVAT